jgi:hypothetical protein
MSNLIKTTYLSECNCGKEVSGKGEYDTNDGTLYGEECHSCGFEFIVSGWIDDRCWKCDLFHYSEEDC